MNREEASREIIYQMTMAIAREMCERRLITNEEYTTFDKQMLQKYEPVLGTFTAEVNLIYPG